MYLIPFLKDLEVFLQGVQVLARVSRWREQFVPRHRGRKKQEKCGKLNAAWRDSRVHAVQTFPDTKDEGPDMVSGSLHGLCIADSCSGWLVPLHRVTTHPSCSGLSHF